MTNGFNLPIELNVPIEVLKKEEEKESLEITYETKKQTIIGKAYNSPKGTNLRKVAEYLWQHQQESLSYEQIAEILNIPESSLKAIVSDLNFYKGFSMTWIPVPKKVGFIQGSLKNYEDYENWDIKKQRTITSMRQVKDKAETIVGGKKRYKKKVIADQKQKVKN